MKKTFYLCLVLCIAAMLCSCEHKELCYNHHEHASRYEADVAATYTLAWEIPYNNLTDYIHNWPSGLGFSYNSLLPEKPEGLRAISYADGRLPAIVNMPADGGVASLPYSVQSLLFINNDTEYIRIVNDDSYSEAMATTRGRSRSSYNGSPYISRNETTVSPPDMLFGAAIGYFDNIRSATPKQLPVDMQPLVFTYAVYCPITHGAEYAGLVRGALAGMASGVNLSTGSTSQTPVTVLFDGEVEGNNVIARVRSFGAPGFPYPEYSRAEGVYAINLEILLKNGKTVKYDFDISGLMNKQPRGGLIQLPGIEISDETGSSDGSGFNITVDGWGEEQDIDIKL